MLARQRGERLENALEAAQRRAGLQDAGGADTRLDASQRLQLVDFLIEVIGGAYGHLPQKRAAYAVDPIQSLQLLRRRCVGLSDLQFHLELTGLVTSLRDAHTRCSGRTVLRHRVARLPFLVEQHGPHGDPTFIVSKVANRALIPRAHGDFVRGVTLEWWNGIPFARALDLHAERETGGRADAMRARALESLTFRSLDHGPQPDERWVHVGYRNLRGKSREVSFPWHVVDPGAAATTLRPGSRGALRVAANPLAETVRRAKLLMFAPHAWSTEETPAVAKAPRGSRTRFHDVLAARRISTPRGDIGYLRIWSFNVDDDDAFIAEVIRILEDLPPSGLIVDLRGNPGGLIWAAERLLQLFTPNEIAPARFSLLASPLTRVMASSPFNRMELEMWVQSLEEAIVTGELYSQAFPLTDPTWCNDIGQCYGGPVVAVVDPNTYSAGDLFAAGFVDNRVGPLVCVGHATGGGGANVWTEAQLRDALADTGYALPPLPEGVHFTIAVRRSTRSGISDGLPIEDLGVQGIPYTMTRRDLLEGNRDLLRYCAELMAELPQTDMQVRLVGGELSIVTRGLDRVDITLEHHPLLSLPVKDGERRVRAPPGGVIDIVGCVGAEVRQRRRLRRAE